MLFGGDNGYIMFQYIPVCIEIDYQVIYNLNCMNTTAYIHKNIKYFYAYSEQIDLEIGSQQLLSLSRSLDILE